MFHQFIVGLAGAGLIYWIAQRLAPLNMKLILVRNQSMGRCARSKSLGTRRR